MINGELIVDNFAGGGGASTGIEIATGYSVDIAINHDPEAIKMHKVNHPSTKHYCESVWDIDPIKVCKSQPVGLAWFSPDCKHFSKAKGGKPKDKTIRGLAWVALRWAAKVRPRVIMLENVEEFKTWGPLNRGHRPIKIKQGYTFKRFVNQLVRLGYVVEFRELIAADYGAPTMRKRFFLVARCDGKPIVWPEPTHGPRDSESVKSGALQPYVGAYTQIDFSRPCPSIFDTAEDIKAKYRIRAQRPLAPKTMQRIARGLQKFVIDNAEQFIVQCNHGGERRPQDIKEPMPTITGKHGYGVVEPYIVPIGYGERVGQEPRIHDPQEPLPTVVSSGKHYLCEPYMVQIGQTGFTEDRSKDVREPLTTIVSKNEHCLISPTLIQYHTETAKDGARGQVVSDPIMTVDGSNRYGLVSAFISKFRGSNVGNEADNPLSTITAGGKHEAVCAAYIMQQQGQSTGTDICNPLNTITAGGMGHMHEVRAFLIKYYSQGTGQDIKEPLDTVTASDRFGLVTIAGVDYQIVDIGLRMLEPRELYGCQGFPEDYIIDHDDTGRAYPRSEQVKRCGNAVPPPFAAALVRANLPELCIGERMHNMRIDDSQEQLRFA